MKIYTKTGDRGTTGLFAGPRVNKDHPRIQAYGAVDELNALLGVVVAALPKDEAGMKEPLTTSHASVSELLSSVQSDLFAVGAELATPNPVAQNMCLLRPERVKHLEEWIDRIEEQLEPLQNFILPGGSLGSAMLHLARTVCRRAERDVVGLSHNEDVHDCRSIIIYLNRLSDLLFVLARQTNRSLGLADTPWQRT